MTWWNNNNYKITGFPGQVNRIRFVGRICPRTCFHANFWKNRLSICPGVCGNALCRVLSHGVVYWVQCFSTDWIEQMGINRSHWGQTASLKNFLWYGLFRDSERSKRLDHHSLPSSYQHCFTSTKYNESDANSDVTPFSSTPFIRSSYPTVCSWVPWFSQAFSNGCLEVDSSVKWIDFLTV